MAETDGERPCLKPLDAPEKSRTYHFPGGDTLTFYDVRAVGVRPSGTHRLETGDGRKHVIAADWLAITLEVDEWTF